MSDKGWTTEPPTVPGMYWVRPDINREWEERNGKGYQVEKVVQVYESWPLGAVRPVLRTHDTHTEGVLWAGPIVPPPSRINVVFGGEVVGSVPSDAPVDDLV